MRAEKDQTCSQTIRKRRYSTEIKEGYIRLFWRIVLIVAVGWLLTGVFVFLVGFSTNSLVLMGVMVFIAGSIMNGAQSSMPALAAGFYPTQGRATGVAWMLGIGRFGGILGAFSGAFLMQAQLSFVTIFTLLSIPAFLSAIALLVKYKTSKSQPISAQAKADNMQKA